jgi:parallel beta-helix repeat protein
VYVGNTVTANTGVGIFHEISWNAVISNNVLTDNDAEDVGLSCWHGAQIFVNTSSDVEITGNTLKASNGANDICAVSADRSETAPYPLAVANLNVHDNTAYMTGSASSGLVVTSTPSKSALAVNNQYAHNKYYVSKQSNGYWEWTSGSQLTWQGWQGQQQDKTGSLASWTGS